MHNEENLMLKKTLDTVVATKDSLIVNINILTFSNELFFESKPSKR